MSQETEEVKVGTNRTGIALARERAEAMVAGARELGPTSEGDASFFGAVRAEYSAEAEPIGTMPPPTSFKGLAKTAMQSISGGQPTLFMDKLGERLAFERTGTRLYEALLSKHDSFGSFAGGPTRAELEKILEEEYEHFRLLLAAIESLSGDPTAVTPSADLSALASQGIGSVIVDPRTTLLQCLEAILIAELTDNEGWEGLVDLAEVAGEEALRESFAQAMEDEHQHLKKVRSWIAAGQGRTEQAEARAAGIEHEVEIERTMIGSEESLAVEPAPPLEPRRAKTPRPRAQKQAAPAKRATKAKASAKSKSNRAKRNGVTKSKRKKTKAKRRAAERHA
jgi:rubrerythrin